MIRENPEEAFSQFVLIDADTDTDLFALDEGDVLDLSTLPANLNLRADVTGPVASVRFTLEPQGYGRVENVMPFALFGDTAGDYFGGQLQVGAQMLTATAYKETGAVGQVLNPVSIAFEVTGGSAPAMSSKRVEAFITLESIPSDYALETAYPNPFNASATIRFALPETATVRLTVYDTLGREVGRIVEGTMEAGRHEVVFDAGDLPSGTYLYRLETPAASFSRTLLLLK